MHSVGFSCSQQRERLFVDSLSGWQPSLALRVPLPVKSMGSLRDQCYWCKEVANLYIPDGLAGGLCPKCVKIICSPNGKPPQPDARARLATLLAKKFEPDVAKKVAMFVHDWTEP